jgi:hypothetical protein
MEMTMCKQQTIVKMVFGSHLYGTSTPESDKDFKGVFLPTREQILLGKIPKSINESSNKTNIKNTSKDVDLEMYSLHYFIHLACEGETVALDMLHAPKKMIIETCPIWNEIVLNRQRFYTKNLKAFVGYARRQASKYGIKGSRLNDAQRVLDFLKPYQHLFKKLNNLWNDLPEGEHIFKHPPNENGERMYEVCGRKIGEKVTFNYAYDTVKKFVDNYDDRARMAANNEGIDWKAISHAFRAAYQVKQILIKNTITFPLKEASTLLLIKQGKLDYQSIVAPKLNDLISEVEELSKNCNLPEKVDRNFWNKFIMDTLEQYHFPNAKKYRELDDYIAGCLV